MLNRLREPFGKAGLVVAIVALVFAMLGGAYAASGGLTGKQKKEVKAIAKSFQGTGPAGAQGPAGAKGDAGGNGDTGPQGKQGLQGNPGTNGTNGKDGTFSTEPLPQGESLTGAWSTSGGPNEESEGDLSLVSISFPIPVSVSPAPIVLLQYLPESALGLSIGDESFAPELEFAVHCPGTVAAPEAEAGYLCVYIAVKKAVFENSEAALLEGANTYGVVLPFRINEVDGYAKGSWAVTAGP